VTLTASLKSKEGENESKLFFYDAEADHKEERYAGGHPIIGVKDSWQISTEHEKQSGVWILDKPVQVKEGDQITVSLGNVMVASARLSVSPFAGEDPLESGHGELIRNALEKDELR